MITKVFDQKGTFKAWHAAEEWCKAQGLSVGFMCGPEPIGLKYGDHIIMKWRNLGKQEIKELDGRITSIDFREGPVTVTVSEYQNNFSI